MRARPRRPNNPMRPSGGHERHQSRLPELRLGIGNTSVQTAGLQPTTCAVHIRRCRTARLRRFPLRCKTTPGVCYLSRDSALQGAAHAGDCTSRDRLALEAPGGCVNLNRRPTQNTAKIHSPALVSSPSRGDESRSEASPTTCLRNDSVPSTQQPLVRPGFLL